MSNKNNKSNNNYYRNKKRNNYRHKNNQYYYHKYHKRNKKDTLHDSVLDNTNQQKNLLEEVILENNGTNINYDEEKREVIEKNDYQEEDVFEEPILKKKRRKNNIELFNMKRLIGYILGPIVLIMLLLGTTYAYFNYYKEDERDSSLKAGEMYVKLSGEAINLSMGSVYPRTAIEARNKNDNYVDFTIVGKNTSEIYAIIYNLKLVDQAIPEGKVQIDHQYMLFDLSLLDENNNETLLINALNFDEFNNVDLREINNIPVSTTEEQTIKYRLRMWVSDEVTVSDTEEATYNSVTFNKLKANFKLVVSTEQTKTSMPVAIKLSGKNIENGNKFILTSVSNNYLLEESGDTLEEDDVIEYIVTNPDEVLYFKYADSMGNSVDTNEDILDLTYNFDKNEDIDVKIYLISKNNTTVNTTINFVIKKNNETIDSYDQDITVYGSEFCSANTKLSDCILISENQSKTVNAAKAFITSKGSPDVNNTAPLYINGEEDKINSQQGLYKVQDDYGDGYIFRGNVTNNNVYFGGYYWKILRINGDGTIRMIYNGTSLDASGNLNKGDAVAINGTTYAFNSVYAGPAYVGYMYDENATSWESGITTYVDWDASSEYYWASSIDDFDELTDTKGTYWKPKSNATLIPATLIDVDLSSYSYTCRSTSSTGTCRVLRHVISKNNSTSAQVKYITVAARSKEAAQTNTKDSNAKKTLESWYQSTFSTKNNNGKKVTTYLADAYFCNDRSITDSTYNSGYSVTTHTYFAARKRLYNEGAASRTATLHCANKNDAFTVNDIIHGNGKLTYPVGLITADEVALAGGKWNTSNTKYYLHTNGYYWTLSPYIFHSTNAHARELNVGPAGFLNGYNVTYSYGLRAVINLKSDVLITEGDGTSSNPYLIS